jgi:hypothetical protein
VFKEKINLRTIALAGFVVIILMYSDPNCQSTYTKSNFLNDQRSTYSMNDQTIMD